MKRVRLLPMLLLTGACALAVAAPVAFDNAKGSLTMKTAFAKHGADDPANHDAGDDRGRNRGGRDDPAGHH